MPRILDAAFHPARVSQADHVIGRPLASGQSHWAGSMDRFELSGHRELDFLYSNNTHAPSVFQLRDAISALGRAFGAPRRVADGHIEVLLNRQMVLGEIYAKVEQWRGHVPEATLDALEGFASVTNQHLDAVDRRFVGQQHFNDLSQRPDAAIKAAQDLASAPPADPHMTEGSANAVLRMLARHTKALVGPGGTVSAANKALFAALTTATTTLTTLRNNLRQSRYNPNIRPPMQPMIPNLATLPTPPPPPGPPPTDDPNDPNNPNNPQASTQTGTTTDTTKV